MKNSGTNTFFSIFSLMLTILFVEIIDDCGLVCFGFNVKNYLNHKIKNYVV